MKKNLYLANLLAFCFLLCSVSLKAQMPIITTSPTSQVACSGSMVKFAVATNDTPTNYIWSVSTDGGTTWATVTNGGAYSGASTDTLSVSAMLSFTGYQYLCKAINGVDTSLPSTAATLTVDTAYIAPITGAMAVCVGNMITMADATTGGTWGNMHPTYDTINSVGVVYGIAGGMDTIKYTKTNSCGTNSVWMAINVDTTIMPSAILGTSALCVGNNATLTDATAGGTWSNTNMAIDTISNRGVWYAIGFGIDTISYSITNSCGTNSVKLGISSIPTTSPIMGSSAVCVGGVITLSNMLTGGNWWSSNMAIDTINNAGVVYGVAKGMDTIYYAVTNVCGTDTMWKAITVDTLTMPAAIAGSTSPLCAGANTTLTDAIAGGMWSNMFMATDTVSSAGVVYGIAGGMDTIKYTITNGCGTNFVTFPITIIPKNAPIIGAAAICAGTTTTFTNDTLGGTWTIHNTMIDTISSTGAVYGMMHGIDTVFYTVTDACGTSTVWKQITIDTLPAAIAGASATCIGATATFTNTIGGGVWSNQNTMIDTISSTGVVYGVSSGTDSVIYSITNSCGRNYVAKMITIDALPSAIVGDSTLCFLTSNTYTDMTSGGTWANHNHAIDTISSAGIVYVMSTGVDTISYTLINGCGTNTVTKQITMITAPSIAAISGATSVCAGTSITLVDAYPGGTWSNQNNIIDTISNTGMVYGVSRGSDTIKYTATNICGTNHVFSVIRIDTVPAAITGMTNVCVGTTTTLAETIPGGAWSRIHAAYDSVSSAGVVHGLAVGNDTIRYILSNACGIDTVTFPINVNTIPSVHAITGTTLNVCVGATLNVTDSTTGGTWSNHFMAYDTVGATSGIVYGLHNGIDTIYYTVTNFCGTTTVHKTLTVNSIPSSGIITGPSGMCVGITVYFNESVTGGVWKHSNTLADNLHGTTTGIAKGLASGIDTIKYITHNVCGADTTFKVIRVDTLNPGTITGTMNFCAGTSVTLTDSAKFGVWSSANTSIAMVDSNGIVTGMSGGNDSIRYTISNSCGTRSASLLLVVNPAPNAGTIHGPSNVCLGSSIVLYDSVAVDTIGVDTFYWSNSNAAVATMAIVGHDSVRLTSVAAGIDTVFYNVVNSCGATKKAFAVHVDTTITTVMVSGSSHVCIGAPTMLTAMPSGGMWSSSNTTLATIDSTGKVIGIHNGNDTINYVYINGCGTDTAHFIDTVYTAPNAGIITGNSSVCLGGVVTLADATTGGVWSVSNGMGTINGTGVFTSVAHGMDTVYYTVTGAHCTGKVWRAESVDSLPAAYPVVGPTTVCVGSTIILSNANTIGTHVWTSSNSNANVSGTGVVMGIAGGMDTIMYQFANACGGDTESIVVTVQTPLVGGALAGPSFVCQGTMITLMDTIAGGVWWSSNPYIASIDSNDMFSAMITGRHLGSVVISYSFWNSCGAATDTQTIIVYGTASAIGGIDSVGVNKHRLLTNATPGGTWTSTNHLLATVDTNGNVTGVLSGIDTIIYTVVNPCGTTTAWVQMHVGNPPSAGTILGLDSVCAGINLYLADTASPHGAWSFKNNKATVDQNGVVTGGYNGPGLDTLVYAVTNGFGTSTTTFKVYVNAVPVIHVHHYAILTVNASYPLLDTPGNGTWWSSDPNSITFSAGYMIIVNPASAASGMDTVVYTASNTCGTSSDTLFIYLPSAVEKINNPQSNMTIYPNPSKGTFNIFFNSQIDEVANVVVTNIVGQKVKEFTITANKPIEISINQPDGVYLLNAATPNARFEQKIMITH